MIPYHPFLTIYICYRRTNSKPRAVKGVARGRAAAEGGTGGIRQRSSDPTGFDNAEYMAELEANLLKAMNIDSSDSAPYGSQTKGVTSASNSSNNPQP